MESNWIRTSADTGDVCPVFRKQWRLQRPVKSARLELTALGTYVVRLNGEKLGRGVLAPGWTSYDKRLQVQTYDLAGLHDRDNELTVTVGRGWCSSPMPGFVESEDKARRAGIPRGIIGCLSICYDDDTSETLETDETWEWTESGTLFSEIYDGESMDARVSLENWHPAVKFQWSKDILIPQEGELITEQERIRPRRIFQTPKGETVVDFGQEITEYVALRLNGKAGQTVRLIHGETLDADGNFYHSNYRTAKAEVLYICRDGYQEWHPELTFFGFRYVKVEAFPGSITSDSLQAVVVCSEIKRTGWLQSGDTMLNKLFSNIFWGQRGNFLDVPTDCPQRDERLGWTGDAQVFVKTASYNYDSERFFRKWLRDLKADQRPDGAVGQVIPDYMPHTQPSAAWGDAAVICPWQIYQTYGDISVLEEQYASMKAWVEYISNTTTTPGLWKGGTHFGDWLALDAPEGSLKGATREDFIASAFYAHSTRIPVQAGKELGEDVSRYERQYERIVQAFRRTQAKESEIGTVHFTQLACWRMMRIWRKSKSMYVFYDMGQYSWMANSISIAQFAIMFVTPILMKKYSKRAIYTVGIGVISVNFLGFGLFGNSVPVMVFCTILKECGLGMAGGMALGLVADTITYGELHSGIDAADMGNASVSAS